MEHPSLFIANNAVSTIDLGHNAPHCICTNGRIVVYTLDRELVFWNPQEQQQQQTFQEEGGGYDGDEEEPQEERADSFLTFTLPFAPLTMAVSHNRSELMVACADAILFYDVCDIHEFFFNPDFPSRVPSHPPSSLLKLIGTATPSVCASLNDPSCDTATAVLSYPQMFAQITNAAYDDTSGERCFICCQQHVLCATSQRSASLLLADYDDRNTTTTTAMCSCVSIDLHAFLFNLPVGEVSLLAAATTDLLFVATSTGFLLAVALSMHNKSIINKSAGIVSPGVPITAMRPVVSQSVLAVGNAAGVIRIFDTSARSLLTLRTTLHTAELISKLLHGEIQRTEDYDGDDDGEQQHEDGNNALHHHHHLEKTATVSPSIVGISNGAARHVQTLIASTPQGLYAVDYATARINQLMSYDGDDDDGDADSGGGGGVCSFACVESSSATLWFPFSRQLSWLALRAGIGGDLCGDDGGDGAADLIHAKAPLPRKLAEPLQIAEACKDPNAKAVTFRKAIKSSGYSSSSNLPWSEQQKFKAAAAAKKKKEALVEAKKKKEQQLQRQQQQSNAAPATTQVLCFDVDAAAAAGPPRIERKNTSTLMDTPQRRLHALGVNQVCFSAQGDFVATAGSDGTATLSRFPFVKHDGEGYCLKGHTSQVLCLDTSLALSNPLVVTGSFDGSVKLWKPTRKDDGCFASLELTTQKREVKAAKFFFNDRFVTACAGKNIFLLKYALDEDRSDVDLNRKRNDSVLKETLAVATEAQQVTALDCYNFFLSNLLMWGGSNKQVGAHDVATNQPVWLANDAHSRPIHSVEVCNASRWTPHGAVSSAALHTVATAAVDKCVRLWDIRISPTSGSPSAVRTFMSHANTSIKTGLCFSPCGRFIACGSEDRSIYVYDVGTGAVVEKMSGLPDVCSALRFHPLEPSLLVCGCISGHIRVFEA